METAAAAVAPPPRRRCLVREGAHRPTVAPTLGGIERGACPTQGAVYVPGEGDFLDLDLHAGEN